MNAVTIMEEEEAVGLGLLCISTLGCTRPMQFNFRLNFSGKTI